MPPILPERVLDAGYETLFLLGGFLPLSVEPTPRQLEKVFDWISESQARRAHLNRLKRRGLIESEDENGEWVPRLTALGRAAFSGGRNPEEAWNRSWDGKWRILTFDLPRSASAPRMKFRRWLCANRFGRLQGSVWISPDPVPDIAKAIAVDQLDPRMVMVFEGELAGAPQPREVASMAWDFGAINTGYRGYIDSTTRTSQQIERKPASMPRLREILHKDRKAWWDAVHSDPLLPKLLHPKAYEGPEAWKARCQLLRSLGKTLDTTTSF